MARRPNGNPKKPLTQEELWHLRPLTRKEVYALPAEERVARARAHTRAATQKLEQVHPNRHNEFIAEHPTARRDASRRFRERYPEYVSAKLKDYKRYSRYGLTKEQYAAMLEKQGGVCAICFSECAYGKKLSVDHDHATGAVRGLLCVQCNLVIGNAADVPAICRSAAEYLERAAMQQVPLRETIPKPLLRLVRKAVI